MKKKKKKKKIGKLSVRQQERGTKNKDNCLKMQIPYKICFVFLKKK